MIAQLVGVGHRRVGDAGEAGGAEHRAVGAADQLAQADRAGAGVLVLGVELRGQFGIVHLCADHRVFDLHRAHVDVEQAVVHRPAQRRPLAVLPQRLR